MNKVILCGRLTRDPEIRYSQTAKPVAIARYTLAVNKTFKKDNEPDVDFINCITFGKSAEFAEKYLRRGTKMLVVGRVQTGSYTNKEGVKIYTTDIIVEEHEFAESKASSNNAKPVNEDNGFVSIPDGIDDDLPFN